MKKYTGLVLIIWLMISPSFIFAEAQYTENNEEGSHNESSEQSENSANTEDTEQTQDWINAEIVSDGDNAYREQGSGLRQKLCNLVKKQIGTAYINGGNSPETGFDCSGLIQYVSYSNGIKIPRVAQDQFETGSAKNIGDLRPGDVVFFQVYSTGLLGEGRIMNKMTEYVKTNPTHVGVYIGGGMFVHAPCAGQTVKVSDLRKPFWRSHLIGIRDYTGETGMVIDHESSTVVVAESIPKTEGSFETVSVDISRGMARAKETAENIMKSEAIQKASEKTSELLEKAKRAFKAAKAEWSK
jgi:cell wall-associated NlpC family hydrolase